MLNGKKTLKNMVVITYKPNQNSGEILSVINETSIQQKEHKHLLWQIVWKRGSSFILFLVAMSIGSQLKSILGKQFSQKLRTEFPYDPLVPQGPKSHIQKIFALLC